MKTSQHDTDNQLLAVPWGFPQIVLAVLFGSFDLGHQRTGSDIDIALGAHRALTAAEKVALIEALTEQTGRAIDLVYLRAVAEPLLGQILRHGRRLLESDGAYGELISRHQFEQADFMPYRARILAERRAAWIGKRSHRSSNHCDIACSELSRRVPPMRRRWPRTLTCRTSLR